MTMGTKKYKPTSAGRRVASGYDFAEITKSAPEKRLTEAKKSTGGRNNQGIATTRFRGGGHKRRYRVIDFRRDKDGIPARVAAIEYDPNRSARIALLNYVDGEKRYILCPDKLQVGAMLMSGEQVEPNIGNAMPLRNVPQGVAVHSIEMIPGSGAKLARSAGSIVQIAAKEGEYALLILPSGEMRRVHLNCRATIGQVGNLEHQSVRLGKAGRMRWLGRKPHNRGAAMNPIDHPMGGGEGRTGGGGRPQVGPTGVLSKGGKTRSRKKSSRKFIVRRRKGRQ
jgi:large subunit ribosomal protein L2